MIDERDGVLTGRPVEPPPQRQPRAWLVGISGGGAAALVGAAGLVSHGVLVGALFVVQVALAAAWLATIGAPGRGGGALIAAGSAAAADAIVLRHELRPAGGLMGVVGLALLAAFVHQLLRRPRPRVTASLAADMSAVALMVSFACLVGLQSASVGESALVVWMCALAFGLPVGRMLDETVHVLPLGKGTHRGIGGLIGGIGVGVLAGAMVGSAHATLGAADGALLGGFSAAAAYVADSVVVRASTDLDPRDRRRIAAIRPLSALLPLAVAAPVTYVVGRILLG